MPCVPASLLRSVVAAVVLCAPACASAAQPLEPPAPQSLPDGRTPGPVPLSGIPAGVTLTDVQWLAADELFAAGHAGDLFDHPGQIGIWRSHDGRSWRQAFLGEELFWWENGSPRIALARTMDGVVAVGTSCRKGCRPIVLVSDDGWWRVVRPGGLVGGIDFHLLVLELAPDGSGRTVWELNDGTGWARLMDAPPGGWGFLPVWTGDGWLLYENSGEPGRTPEAWFAASAAPDDPPLDGP